MCLFFLVGYVSLATIALANYTGEDRKCEVDRAKILYSSEFRDMEGWRCSNIHPVYNVRRCVPRQLLCNGDDYCGVGDSRRESNGENVLDELCQFFNPPVLHPGCHLTSCHACAADKTIQTSSTYWNGSVDQCRRCNHLDYPLRRYMDDIWAIYRRCNDGSCYNIKVGCDGKKDCLDGTDEWGCPWYTQVSTTNTLAACFGIVFVSLTMFMILKRIKFIDTKVEKYEGPMEIDFVQVDNLVAKMKTSPEMEEEVIQIYHDIHKSNQISELISALNIFCIGITKSHKISRVILELEDGIHGGRRQALLCLRVNAGSNEDIERLLSFEGDPGCLNKMKEKVVQSMDAFLNQFCIRPLVACFPNIKKWSYNITKTFMAGVKVTIFLWDFIKDLVLWALLYGKADELKITDSENFLLWIFFSLIFCGQSITGFYITSKYKTILSLPNSMKTWKKVFVLVAMFLLTPCLPSLVIFKATVYSTDMAAIVADARNNPCSQPSTVLQRINSLKEKHRIHMQIYAYARVIEATLETFPQVIVLSSFLTKEATLGTILLYKENLSTSTSLLFLISIPYSIMMTVTAIIGFINTQKRSSLGFLTSSILGMSYLFQLTSSFISWLFIFGAITNGHSPSGNMFLVLITLVTTWLFTYIWTYIVVEPFSKAPILERMLHVLVNTFVTIPFRDAKDESQRRKSTEIFWHLLFRSFENLAMVTIGCYLVDGFPEIDGGFPQNLSTISIDFLSLNEYEIPIGAILPVCLFFQLLGGLFMWIFYKNHHWKEINESGCHFCCFPSTPCVCSPTGLCKILGCFFLGFIQIIFCCCCDLWIIWWRCLPLHKFQWVGWGKKKFDIPDRNTVATDELVSLTSFSQSPNTQQEQRLPIHHSSETSSLCPLTHSIPDSTLRDSCSFIPIQSSTSFVPRSRRSSINRSNPNILTTISSTNHSISIPSMLPIISTTNLSVSIPSIIPIRSITRSMSIPSILPSTSPTNCSTSISSAVPARSPSICPIYITSIVPTISIAIKSKSCTSAAPCRTSTFHPISSPSIVPTKSPIIHTTSYPSILSTRSRTIQSTKAPKTRAQSCPSRVPTTSTIRATTTSAIVSIESATIDSASIPPYVPSRSLIMRYKSCPSLVLTKCTIRAKTTPTIVPSKSSTTCATSISSFIPTIFPIIRTKSCFSLVQSQSKIRGAITRTINPNESATIRAASSQAFIPTGSPTIYAKSCTSLVPTQSLIKATTTSTILPIKSAKICATSSSSFVPTRSPRIRSASCPSSPSKIRSISSSSIISARSPITHSISSLVTKSTKSSIISSTLIPSKPPVSLSISTPSIPSAIRSPTISSKYLKNRSTSCPSLATAFPQLSGLKTENESLPHLKALKNSP